MSHFSYKPVPPCSHNYCSDFYSNSFPYSFLSYHQVCILRHCSLVLFSFLNLVSFKYLLIYSLPLCPFLLLAVFLLKNACQNVNFTDCTLILQFSMFLHPLYLLQIGSWIQSLGQTLVQSLWYYYRQCCVLSSGGTLLGFSLFMMIAVGLNAQIY